MSLSVRSLHIALITVGNTGRLTGGYLYQARVIAGLRARGVWVDEVVASEVSFDEQRGAADAFAARFMPHSYDVIIVDALARVVCAPSIDSWRRVRPVVVLVHQLASVAEYGCPTTDDRPPEVHSATGHVTYDHTSDERQIDIACEDALLRADLVIAVSAHGRNMLTARGVPVERTVIISPGFDRLDGMIQTASTPPQVEERIVLCVAQWVPRKGLLTLVGAWQRASPSRARLVLIGETEVDRSYSEHMRAAIGRNPDGIEVCGIVSDRELAQAYQRASLFVLPSRFEGYGMVYAEALSHGLPVIATNVGPIPDLVTMAAGRWVAPDDERSLADMLLRLLDDDVLLQELRAGARQRATMLPTWDDAVDGFIDVLSKARRTVL